MADRNRQIRIVELPRDKLSPNHFRMEEAPIPQPGPGEVLVRNRLLSIDPANRAWMQGRTYRDAVNAGQVMAGYGLGEVVASNAPGFAPGDIVEGEAGWQDYVVQPANALAKRARHDPLTHLVSVLGLTGKTAYFGLLEIGKPREGETVVVSAAAGATGSVVGQIARIKGARVVGIAGGPDKCRFLREELGFDAAIDYKAENVAKSLRSACPSGIDVYFDNVGGDILEAVLFQMNPYGRVVCCGAVSQYDTANPQPGPRGIPGLIIVKRLLMQGFIVMDFADRDSQAEADLASWSRSGQIKVVEDVIDGLENAPQALVGLLHGENLGKRIVRIA